MQALNDLAMIKLDAGDPYGFGNTDSKTTAESGILVSLSDKLNYYGYWSFAFENSFMAHKELEELHTYWKKKIGKRVFWTALAERGNIIENDDGEYAFVKFTSLIAVDEADSTAHNVHSDGAGSFGLEK